MIIGEETRTAAVDPNVVWERWTNVDHWPADQPGVDKARLNGPIAQGAVGYIRRRRGGRRSFRIAEVDRSAGRFVIESKLPFARLYEDQEFARVPTDGGGPQQWKLTQRVRIEGPFTALWSRTLGRRLAAQLPAALDAVVARSQIPQSTT